MLPQRLQGTDLSGGGAGPLRGERHQNRLPAHRYAVTRRQIPPSDSRRPEENGLYCPISVFDHPGYISGVLPVMSTCALQSIEEHTDGDTPIFRGQLRILL